MARYLSWLVNLALAVLACFLLAQSVNSVFAALLAAPPAGDPVAEPEGAAAGSRPWSDREIILSRNLFNASTLSPAPGSLAEAEVLEATELPLTLLGTAAVDDPELSWAAIEDRDSQQTLVLRIGDSVRSQAQLRRIERKRIVLEEKGALRELALVEAEGPSLAPTPGPAAGRPPRRAAARAARQRPMPSLPQMATAPEEGPRSPARLFSEARILPKYEAGQMVGVQVSAIKPGSLFEQMGIQDGDVITELNGIRIDSPEQSAKILLELGKTEAFTVQVEGASGTRTLNVDLPEP
jgi:general secretion pathway protein C